jgi:hypothetical protein
MQQFFNNKVERLEDELFSFESKEEIALFLEKNKILKEHFLVSSQYPHDSILVSHLYDRITNPFIDSLLMEARVVFDDDLLDIAEEFSQAFKQLKYYYPDISTPKIQTMVTGMGSSELYVSDSLIIIGLDFYLGPGATYRPLGIPAYILKRYQKEYIVPASILLLSNTYIKENHQDKTMLADMVYYGKKYYFTKLMMPCTPDSLLIWYSGQELKDVEENQDIIWANFVQNQLLYETNHFTKKKFLDERPKVYEIGDKCPGRIGTWLGWEIVSKYMEETQVDLHTLMNEPDANKIFTLSNYKPNR